MFEARREDWLRRAREALASPAVLNSAIVASGNAAQALASLGTTVMVTRSLGPSSFGVFSVALGAATAIAPMMDFGLNPSLLRHAARADAAGDAGAFARLMRAYAQLNVVFFLAVGAVFLAVSGPLAREVMHFEHLALLRWACAGALSLNLLVLGRSLLEARQRFRDVAVVTSGTALARLGVIAALRATSGLTPAVVLLVYLALPAAGLLYALTRLKDIPFARTVEGGVARERRELLVFGGWAGVLALLSALSNYLDLALINRWCDAAAVGCYAAAYRLAFVIITASLPIGSVLRARASAFKTLERLEAFLDKLKLLTVVAAIGVAAVWAAAPLAVRLFFGPAYAEAVPLLRVLAVGTGFMFAEGPYLTAFYALGRSRPLAAIGLAQLLFFLPALAVLVPLYGVIGAAWAFALLRALTFALALVLVRSNIAASRSENPSGVLAA
jgi:O-antigen/teichoic acid export membrane protein